MQLTYLLLPPPGEIQSRSFHVWTMLLYFCSDTVPPCISLHPCYGPPVKLHQAWWALGTSLAINKLVSGVCQLTSSQQPRVQFSLALYLYLSPVDQLFPIFWLFHCVVYIPEELNIFLVIVLLLFGWSNIIVFKEEQVGLEENIGPAW